jgi:hypothetical protein
MGGRERGRCYGGIIDSRDIKVDIWDDGEVRVR